MIDLRKLLADASTLFMQFDVGGLKIAERPDEKERRWLITRKGQILQPQAEKLWNKGEGISTIEYQEMDDLIAFVRRLAVPSIEIYIAYARKDKNLWQNLKTYLINLHRDMIEQCNIVILDDGEITAGTDWQKAFQERLRRAHVILLLVSADFLVSEVGRDSSQKAIEAAMERHDRDEARVIPILLRPSFWKKEKFARLAVVPSNEKPIKLWSNHDVAYLEVAQEIKEAIEELLKITYRGH